MASFELDKVMVSNKFEEKKVNDVEELDDWSSAWNECKKLGLKWGGRGRGGRAAGRMTVQTRDVVIEGCTMSFLGNNLLERTTLRLLHGRRYGLIGRNGVGKSTLMSRIATGTLPGFPQHLVVAQVSQELPRVIDPTINPVDFVVKCNPERLEILKVIEQIESGETKSNTDNPMEEADLLCSLYEVLEDEGIITSRAIKILKNLGFGDKRREMPLLAMSGGWKMRVSIACALVQQPNILLLDEPTNHLDLEGVEWLKSYLSSSASEDMTILVTSHDKYFLDEVCTDIIRFHRQQLHYYPGNYTAFEIAYQDKELNNQRMQEGIDRRRSQLEDTIKRMQIVASKSDSAQGAVASKKKKLLRTGAEKNSKGFRFRAQQDSTHGQSSIRAGSMCETAMGTKTGESRTLVDTVEREWHMTLPSPLPLSTLGCYLQVRSATLGYTLHSSTDPKVILRNITLDIQRDSKIGLVGKNGSGKSTLMQLIEEYDHDQGGGKPVDSDCNNRASPVLLSGTAYKANHLKVAYFQQHQQDCLPYDMTSLEHMTSIAPAGHNEQMLRAHLGSFGLGGDLVLRPIGTLSGGQKSRVVLAELTIVKPHLLLLDEPTNNLDMDSIKAFALALKSFEGAYIIASHDMAFLNETVNEVYCIAKSSMTKLEGGAEEYKAIVKKSVISQKV